MTDSAGSVPPFPGFPGFPPAEMLDRMWGMMRLTPFGSAFPGSEPGAAQGFGQGLGPSLSMMSDMMTPLTNIEELDKRVTDLRAVEQWLKLNLNMLQSAIQALEVQRATLSTLRAFGAFAQSQMSPPPAHEAPRETASASSARESASSTSDSEAAADAPAGFDASAWWNLLQSQFNQLAQFAMAQPAAAAQAAQAAAEAATQAASAAGETAARAKPAAKRSSGGASASAAASKTGARSAKKAPARSE